MIRMTSNAATSAKMIRKAMRPQVQRWYVWQAMRPQVQIWFVWQAMRYTSIVDSMVYGSCLSMSDICICPICAAYMHLYVFLAVYIFKNITTHVCSVNCIHMRNILCIHYKDVEMRQSESGITIIIHGYRNPWHFEFKFEQFSFFSVTTELYPFSDLTTYWSYRFLVLM